MSHLDRSVAIDAKSRRNSDIGANFSRREFSNFIENQPHPNDALLVSGDVLGSATLSLLFIHAIGSRDLFHFSLQMLETFTNRPDVQAQPLRFIEIKSHVGTITNNLVKPICGLERFIARDL